MHTIDVLIAVDTMGALASGNLQDNVYLIDTNKHMGSGNEGQAELYTKCHKDQAICWRVSSIAPSNDVNIVGFTGQIMNDKVCVPKKEGTNYDTYWEGVVEDQCPTGRYQYSVTLSMDGKQMTFDPFLDVE